VKVLEASEAVKFHARNDHLGLAIKYEYLGVDHDYEPDFLVRLTNGVTLILEIKGYEVHNPEQIAAKHNAARRWVLAVNNLGEFGSWGFLVCRDLTELAEILRELARTCPPAKWVPMWRVIPNDRITLTDIPAPDALWDVISEFALSYYCHTQEGSLSGEYNCEQPPVGADLDRLRAWLFYQQRCIRGGYMDDPDEDPVLLAPLRQAIEAIREQVAGMQNSNRLTP